jgi:hypothetical protein
MYTPMVYAIVMCVDSTTTARLQAEYALGHAGLEIRLHGILNKILVKQKLIKYVQARHIIHAVLHDMQIVTCSHVRSIGADRLPRCCSSLSEVQSQGTGVG